MNLEVEKDLATACNKTAGMENPEEIPAEFSKDASSFGGASSSGSVGVGLGLSKGAKPRRGARGPSKSAFGNQKMNGPGKVSVGTQVDVRVWVSEKDLKNQKSRETYWRKMAETSQAAVTELRDDNRKLHTTIDYLSRENIRYQNIIEEQGRFQGIYNVSLPPLYDDQEEERNDGYVPDPTNSLSL